MRIIGHLENEAHARVFGDYLYSQGIDNDLEPDREGAWAVWVHGEDELERAVALLDRFRNNPGDPKYQHARAVAQERRDQEVKQVKAAERRYFDRSRLMPRRVQGMGFLTTALIGVCIVVFLLEMAGLQVGWLYMSEFSVGNSPLDRLQRGLIEVRQGQIWRLVTPILLHPGGVLHVLFNMLWLRQLGTMMEIILQWRRYAAFVIAIALLSNFGQFLVSGPLFGGMSGVVYGLLGYVWMRGKFDPASGFHIDPQIVTFMTIWFFICLFGVIPNVANAAHGVGFVAGIGWGYAAAWRANN
jgi:GlpG protein